MKEREYKKIHMYLIICAEEKEEIHQKVKEICYRLVVNGRPFEYLSLLDTVMRKEKRIQKTERGISERWNNFKWPNIKVTEVSEGKDRKKIG